ncbi:hypothetical protein GCM10007907_09520 [Chitinimonas prasina]|uniref:histidine kinase n=1 Tax=Chitinimonas prasina TaxID=1434937 RepID=A0ABQ5YEZ3_9NEIS|nr:PAS domain S-box protein [Chitinimonas prasina]GLR12162.1 hypothetical protein GCM10007907_09520 [Chitinimonas prasina]
MSGAQSFLIDLHRLHLPKSVLYVFVACIAAVLVAAQAAREHNEELIVRAAAGRIESISSQIKETIHRFQYGLRGVRGAILTAGVDQVGYEDFRRYSRSRNIRLEFPGALGFGFIRYVPRDREAAFLAQMRKDVRPDFRIRTLSPNDGDRYVIQFIEPSERNAAAIGLDVASEQNRRAAADKALKTGLPTLTGPITLVQTSGKAKQSFLFMMPIFADGSTPASNRMNALVGWSYAPLSMSDVLSSIKLNSEEEGLKLADVPLGGTPVNIYKAGPGRAIDVAPLATKNNHFHIFGRTWQIEYEVYPAFTKKLPLISIRIIAILGSLLTILITIAFWMYQANRVRKLELAEARNALASIVDSAVDGIIGKTLSGQVTSWNQSAEKMFGYVASEAIGNRLVDLIVPEGRIAEEEGILATISKGEAIAAFETIRRRKDGSMFDVSVSVAPIRNQAGQIIGASKTVRDITLQKQAKMALARVNQQLETEVAARTAALTKVLNENQILLRAINEQLLYSTTDLAGRILDANKNFCLAHGYLQEDLVGQDHRILRSGLHDADFYKNMWSTLSEGNTWRGEICNITKSGQQRWFDTVIAPIVGADGKAERYIALRVDITEQRTAIAETNRLNVLLTGVLQSASELSIIVTQTDGTIVLFNHGAERMLGYAADDMIGKETPALFHLPGEVQKRGRELSDQFGVKIEGFRVFVHVPEIAAAEVREWTYVRKSGEHLTVSLAVTAMRDTKGQISGYLGVAVDVTEIRRQQRELAAARDQLLLAADVAHLGIWSWLVSDNSLTWNAQMFAIYDQPASLAGNGLNYEHWRSRVHPEDIESTEASLLSAVAGHGEYDPIFRVVRTDGSIRHIQAGAYIERDADGKAFRVTGINLDITERKQFEQTILDAKMLAEQASVTKSQFLANMSHEIRTPLNATLGMLQLLRQTPLTERQADYAVKAQSAAHSLLGLLNDILDFSKIEAGKLQLDNHVFVLEELMRDLSVVLSGNVGDKNVEVLFDLDTNLPRAIMGDRLRLQQILINLAGNAVKFTAEGQVVISVANIGEMGSEIRLRFAVTDTGIGISQEQQARIFEGFSQAEASTTRKYGGTGLGLAISKRLVELMGGELKLFSEAGKGSRFWFEISTEAVGERGLEASLIADKLGHTPQVLIVDDNEASSVILSALIQTLGWGVDTASSGAEALDKMRECSANATPPDIVLMDWRMPEMSGLTAAELIRHQFTQQPIIVMITAFGREALQEAYDQTAPPFSTILTKPFTPVQLVQALNKCFGLVSESAPLNMDTVLEGQLEGLHLLVVEDNALNRQVAAELLESVGAQVSLAEGGLRGVELATADETHFDIIIMDMQMPDIDGLEATRRIRQHPRGSNIPIVAMTANASLADRELCLAAGMNEHTGKPISLSTVVPVLLKVLGREVPHKLTPTPDSPPSAQVHDIESWSRILSRFGGNVKTYRFALGAFLPEVEEQVAALRVCVDTGDMRRAGAYLHALKGVASTVGAITVAAYAAKLESGLKAAAITLSMDDIDAIVKAAESAAATLEGRLESEVEDSLPAGGGANSAHAIGGAAWEERAAALLVLLRDSNMQAINDAESLVQAAPSEYGDIARNICNLVQNLQFVEAVALIEKITRKDS